MRVDHITQLFVRRHESKDATASYELHVERTAGRPIALVTDESRLESVRAIEQIVEEHLGLEDRHVPGEAGAGGMPP